MTRDILVRDVGPRDGLQREKTHISVDEKVALIEDLVAAASQGFEQAPSDPTMLRLHVQR